MIVVKKKKKKTCKKAPLTKANDGTSEAETLMNGEIENQSQEHNDEEDLEYSYKPSLTKVLARAFGWYFFVGNVFKFFHDCLLLSSPLLLG